jgi:hypothetical protein
MFVTVLCAYAGEPANKTVAINNRLMCFKKGESKRSSRRVQMLRELRRMSCGLAVWICWMIRGGVSKSSLDETQRNPGSIR